MHQQELRGVVDTGFFSLFLSGCVRVVFLGYYSETLWYPLFKALLKLFVVFQNQRN